MRSFLSLGLVAAVLGIAGLSLAAAPTGAIKGYVRDPSGAAVRNAAVVATSEKTGVSESTVSDSTGLYQFVNLNPATYKITAEATGFRKTEVENVVLLVDQIVALDVQLEIGNVSQSVQVSSTVELLQTESPSTASNITAQQVSNLPLANRQFTDLATLTPGTSFAAPGAQAGSFAAAGTRSQSTNWQIDGVNAIDPNVNGPTNSYRIADAIQELDVQTTAYSAQYGRASGAQVSVITKSGGNQFHGGVFEFDRNNILDANNFFTNALHGAPQILRYNQFGGTLGGPIKHDKTFFFYSFEALKEINPSAATAVVPTVAQRASVLDPISRNLLAFYPLPTLPNAPAGTTNFVGNVPNSTDDYTNLIRIDHTFSERDQLSGRYILYRGTTASGGGLPTTGGNTNSPSQQNAQLSESHTFSPNFVTQLRLGFSRNKTNFRTQDANVNAADILPGVPGVVNSEQNPQDAGIPTVSISGGYATLGSATNIPQGRRSNTYELYWDGTKIVTVAGATHTIHFGYYGRREETWRFLDGTSRGSVSFANFAQFAGTCAGCNGVAEITMSTIRTGDTLGHWYRYPHAFYVQDDIKAAPNFTFSIGLRYELPSVLKEKRDKGTNFVPGVGPVLLGTNLVMDVNTALVGPASLTYVPGPVSLSNAGVTPDYHDFSPTVGFAYTPKSGNSFLADGKTVIRGGFRIGFDDLFNNIPINQTSNAPWSLATTQRAGVTQPSTYSWNLAFNQNVPLISRTASGTEVGLVTFNGEALNAKQAYAENWNFTVQREVRPSLSIEASYVGTSGHHLGVVLDENQPSVIVNNPSLRGSQAPNVQIFPYPTWSNSYVSSFVGSSIYNGLVVTGKWRVGANFYMSSSYTWSHAIDDTSSFLGTTFDAESPASSDAPLNSQRSNSAFDQRHRFVNTFVYQLPFGKGARFFSDAHGVVNQLVSGWSVSGITNITTGQPFTVLTNTNVDYSGFNQLLDRPNYICSGPLQVNTASPGNAFNTACFAPAYAGVVGSTPRNAFYGPGLIDFDATAAKRFAISERIGFEFRSDFFNVLNHTNFALTSADRILSNGQFGQISATAGLGGGINGGPRVIQLTGRFYF